MSAKQIVNFVSQQFLQTHGVWSKKHIVYLAVLSSQVRLYAKLLSDMDLQRPRLS